MFTQLRKRIVDLGVQVRTLRDQLSDMKERTKETPFSGRLTVQELLEPTIRELRETADDICRQLDELALLVQSSMGSEIAIQRELAVAEQERVIAELVSVVNGCRHQAGAEVGPKGTRLLLFRQKDDIVKAAFAVAVAYDEPKKPEADPLAEVAPITNLPEQFRRFVDREIAHTQDDQDVP